MSECVSQLCPSGKCYSSYSLVFAHAFKAFEHRSYGSWVSRLLMPTSPLVRISLSRYERGHPIWSSKQTTTSAVAGTHRPQYAHRLASTRNFLASCAGGDTLHRQPALVAE